MEQSILFYDGDCGFCNRSVTWILKHESEQKLFFASLQSKTAEEILSTQLPDYRQLETLVLYQKGKIYLKSSAAFQLVPFLKRRWRFLSLFRLFPEFLRDKVYDFIARNRKRLAKPNNCQLPSNRERFLL
jgi:predicted DCC family thiol-disulfide oxidoreductase YuxK